MRALTFAALARRRKDGGNAKRIGTAHAANEIRRRSGDQAGRGRASRHRAGRLCDRLFARGRAERVFPQKPACPCELCRRRHGGGARHAGRARCLYSQRFRRPRRSAVSCASPEFGRDRIAMETVPRNVGGGGLPCRRHRRDGCRGDGASGARRRRDDRDRMGAGAGRRRRRGRDRAGRAAALFQRSREHRLRHANRRQARGGRRLRKGRQGRTGQGRQPARRRQLHGAAGRGRRI